MICYIRVGRKSGLTGEEEDDIQLPAPDSYLKGKKKKEKRHKNKKPYGMKKLNKIKDLDPVFIGEWGGPLRRTALLFVYMSVEPRPHFIDISLFAADLELISTNITNCSLYNEGERPLHTTLPKYILSFGEYALTHPPKPPVILSTRSQPAKIKPAHTESQKTTSRGARTNQRTTQVSRRDYNKL